MGQMEPLQWPQLSSSTGHENACNLILPRQKSLIKQTELLRRRGLPLRLAGWAGTSSSMPAAAFARSGMCIDARDFQVGVA